MLDLNFVPDAVAARLPGSMKSVVRDLDQRLTRLTARPLSFGAAGVRSGLYLAESVPLFRLQRLLSAESGRPPAPPPGARDALLDALRGMAELDAAHIAAGFYPLAVLAPESSPIEHAARYVRLLVDSVQVAARKRDKKPREFKGRAADLARELPDYYRRNFHFQTDGYLSDASADLYEHQVEILFRGVADTMRRQVVPPLKRRFAKRTDGRGLRILELASGTGTATRFLAQAFPKANITCVDLSHPYLRTARKRLRSFERVDFMQGDATNLDLREERFDAVCSVFLFHELPKRQREKVLAEARRVLKPGGLHVVVDSLQKGDVPSLDWALDEFPRQFHEPYFRNYVRNPVEAQLEDAGFGPPQTDFAFLSKIVSARR